MKTALRHLCAHLPRPVLPALTYLSALLATASAQAQVTGTINGLAADAQVDKNGSAAAVVTRLTSTYNYVGASSGVDNCVVYVFQVPSSVLSDSSLRFTQASLTLKLGSTINAAAAVNGDLYGVGYSTSSTVLAEDFYRGALDTANMLIQDNLMTPATANYATLTANNTAMVDYLNQCLDNARNDGATNAYVFFRVNADGFSYGNHYGIAMAEAGGTAIPKLAYTAEPISSWRTLPLGGGGFVTGIISDPTGNRVYIRTDVGGAFRWDPVKTEWKNITDNIVPVSTPGAADLMGITAIALDPSNSNRLYIGAGKTNYAALKGIFVSENAGNTWTQINSSIIMQGNGGSRDLGERLAVDPNNPNLVWYGSSTSGLHKGVKSGSTWTWSVIPATSVPFGATNTGIPFVICDKNGTSTITYAGVYNTDGTGGVYKTTDAGSTWTKVGGAVFTTPNRAGIATNGTLYVTSGSQGVFKAARNGTFAQLTALPTGKTYRGIAVAQNDATGNTFYVANNGADFYRSTNGGTSFSAMGANFNSGNKQRREPDGTPSLTGYWWGNTSSLMVNPTNSNELWAADFFGVARTQNAQDMGTTNGPMWYLLQKEQEETVAETIKSSPTGPRLMIGVADVGGFRYNDTTKRPYGTFGNTFGNPSGGSTIGMDFSEANTNIWARTWVNGPHNGGSGAISIDGGVKWITMGGLDYKPVANASTDGPETFDTSVYTARQKAKGINQITFLVASGNSISPLYNNGTINFYSKENATASNRPQLIINGSTVLYPTADAYVADGATTTNYGTVDSLQTSYNFNNAPYTRRIFLKFDLSSFSGTINTATLRLVRKAQTNTVSWNLGVWVVPDTTWSETAITWAAKPNVPAGNGDPVGDPRYYSGAVALLGGRIAVSSTNPNNMVWLPEGLGKVAQYSTDRGASWTASTGGPGTLQQSQFAPSVLLTEIAADRANGKFYFAKYGGTAHIIYRSTDGGATWATTAATVPANAYNVYRCQIVAAPTADHVYVCDDGVDNTTKGGVWKSTNGGDSWTKCAGTTAVRQVTFGKAQSGSGYTVFINGYVGGVKGVWRSNDYGATWTALDEVPTACAIETMSGDRQTYGKVWIGTAGRGLFEGQ